VSTIRRINILIQNFRQTSSMSFGLMLLIIANLFTLFWISIKRTHLHWSGMVAACQNSWRCSKISRWIFAKILSPFRANKNSSKANGVLSNRVRSMSPRSPLESLSGLSNKLLRNHCRANITRTVQERLHHHFRVVRQGLSAQSRGQISRDPASELGTPSLL
jgi:hypothetical protein